MKHQIAIILLLAISCALPSRALRLEPQPNPTSAPLPVVDIEDASHTVVAHLYVLPGEKMLLDSDDQKPHAGAGYYEAMPGEDYFLLVLSKLQFPRLGGGTCPCALHMEKIGWNHQGEVTIITGLRPFLETASGTQIPIVSDVNHPRIANGKLYFKLQGHWGEYWVLTRFGQVVEVGGLWGLWEITRFLLAVLLPLAVLGLLGYTLAGAIRLLREDTYPEKSFIELMQLSFMRLPLANKLKPDTPIPSIRGE
jgi:hypothetical protein